MRRVVTLIAAVIFAAGWASACTSAIVSGKYTPDGRPLMWKHRDNDEPRTKLIYYSEGRYDMIVLVNAGVEKPGSIWFGFNSAGFSIMNTLSYNIEGESTAATDRNGTIMREALANCASVDEFEQFLKEYQRPMKVKANFGTIDANGGAAYFEVNNNDFVKIDVNDTRIAPHGYVVRTNYSFTGTPHEGAGYIRFQTAENLFYRASGYNSLTVPYLLENMCRSLENSYTGQNIKDYLTMPAGRDNFIYYQDCINRHTSTSSVIVQGVRPGESPFLTTMWAIIGTPLSSMVVPVWLNTSKSLPEVVTAKGREAPEVCEYSLSLKNIMVPSMRGSTKYYINTTRVFNSDGTGITQRLLPLERVLVAKAFENLESWRNSGKIDQAQLLKFYSWTDEYVRTSYRETFGLGSQLPDKRRGR